MGEEEEEGEDGVVGLDGEEGAPTEMADYVGDLGAGGDGRLGWVGVRRVRFGILYLWVHVCVDVCGLLLVRMRTKVPCLLYPFCLCWPHWDPKITNETFETQGLPQLVAYPPLLKR